MIPSGCQGTEGLLQEYKYQCRDRSIITPAFKRFVVKPCLSLVPRAVPANIITIVSNLFVYLALVLVLAKGPEFRPNFLLAPLLLLLYAIGDHLDGMQAKRTGTSSPLGEFCDHYLDAFNNGILMVITFVLFGVQNVALICVVFALMYAAHAAVFFEEFKTRWLVFERLGSLEGLLLTIVILLLGWHGPLLKWLGAPVVLGLSPVEIMLLLSALGGVVTIISMFARVRIFSVRFAIFFVCLGLVAVFAGRHLSLRMAFCMFTLYCGEYIGRLMRGHLVDGRERLPDLLFPLFAGTVLVLSCFSIKVPEAILWATAAYLGLLVSVSTVRTFLPLSRHWVWSNPPVGS